MKKVQKMMLYAILPLCFAATVASAQGIGLSGSYVRPPNWESMMEKLTPEQRAKVIDIEQQMLRMQVDHDEEIAKTEGHYQHAMMQLESTLFDIFKGH
jgi:hypothetical protein